MGLSGDLRTDVLNNFSLWFNPKEKKYGIVSIAFGSITLHMPLVKFEELIEQGVEFLESYDTKEVKRKLEESVA